MIKFRQYPDTLGGNNSAAMEQSDSVFIRELDDGTETTIATPASARFALFQYDVTKLWVRFDGDVLTVPNGDADDSDVSLNPDIRYVSGIDTIRLISDTDGTAVVSFYG